MNKESMKEVSFKNRWNVFKDYMLGPVKNNFPITALIELTNHCNLACVMCPHSKMVRAKGFMDETLFRKIIDELKVRGIDKAMLHGTGESLMHPRLADLIGYATKNQVRTEMFTNGVLLTKEKAESIFAAGLDYLQIAFDGEGPESYESIRKKANFNVVSNNIREAIRLQSDIRKKAGAKKKHVIIQSIGFPGQKGNLFHYFSKEDTSIVEFRYKVYFDSYNSDEKPIPHFRKCCQLWTQAVICWNGDIAMCCSDYDGRVILGNVNISSIENIWNNEKFRKIREKHRQVDYQDVPVCSSCSIPNSIYCKPIFTMPAILVPFSVRQKGMYFVEKIGGFFRGK